MSEESRLVLPNSGQPGSCFGGFAAVSFEFLHGPPQQVLIDVPCQGVELSDVDELGDLQAIEAELAELLAADDVEHLAAAMDPGSTAGVIVYETCGLRRSRQRPGVLVAS